MAAPAAYRHVRPGKCESKEQVQVPRPHGTDTAPQYRIDAMPRHRDTVLQRYYVTELTNFAKSMVMAQLL